MLPGMHLSDLYLLAPSGVVSTGFAEQHGIDRRALALAARQGEVTRLVHGWYTPETDLTADAFHRLLSLAMAIAYAGRATPSHYSASLLRGLPVYGVDRSRAHLTRLSPGKTRKRAGLTLWCPSEGHAEPEEIRLAARSVHLVTTAEGVCQTALVAGLQPALVTADAALRDGMMTVPELAAAAETMTARRGGHGLSRLVERADGRHESVGETRTAYLLHQMGLRFTPQVWIGGGDARYRADFVLDDAPVVIEFDGAVKYDGRAALVAEKRREDRIRAHGMVVVRVTWEDLEDPRRLQARIMEAISAARYGRPA